ncbi:MAG TPA: hypothetical protein VFJ27_07955 [Terriglobia bacterium]|nr:hypothetical protein [Terriglobia bacterium]
MSINLHGASRFESTARIILAKKRLPVSGKPGNLGGESSATLPDTKAVAASKAGRIPARAGGSDTGPIGPMVTCTRTFSESQTASQHNNIR